MGGYLQTPCPERVAGPTGRGVAALLSGGSSCQGAADGLRSRWTASCRAQSQPRHSLHEPFLGLSVQSACFLVGWWRGLSERPCVHCLGWCRVCAQQLANSGRWMHGGFGHWLTPDFPVGQTLLPLSCPAGLCLDPGTHSLYSPEPFSPEAVTSLVTHLTGPPLGPEAGGAATQLLGQALPHL